MSFVVSSFPLGGTAFRGASFNDLVYPGYGVLTVRPEHSRSVELGVQWREGTQAASATLYRNRVRDLIGYQPDRSFCPAGSAYNFGCAGNVSRAVLKGATLTAAQRLGDFGLRVRRLPGGGEEILGQEPRPTRVVLVVVIVHPELINSSTLFQLRDDVFCFGRSFERYRQHIEIRVVKT